MVLTLHWITSSLTSIEYLILYFRVAILMYLLLIFKYFNPFICNPFLFQPILLYATGGLGLDTKWFKPNNRNSFVFAVLMSACQQHIGEYCRTITRLTSFWNLWLKNIIYFYVSTFLVTRMYYRETAQSYGSENFFMQVEMIFPFIWNWTVACNHMV